MVVMYWSQDRKLLATCYLLLATFLKDRLIAIWNNYKSAVALPIDTATTDNHQLA